VGIGRAGESDARFSDVRIISGAVIGRSLPGLRVIGSPQWTFGDGPGQCGVDRLAVRIGIGLADTGFPGQVFRVAACTGGGGADGRHPGLRGHEDGQAGLSAHPGALTAAGSLAGNTAKSKAAPFAVE
jgi:hypothetical protein